MHMHMHMHMCIDSIVLCTRVPHVNVLFARQLLDNFSEQHCVQCAAAVAVDYQILILLLALDVCFYDAFNSAISDIEE